MTQEEKQLLFRYLCMGLPYGVYVKYENDGIEETRELGLGTLHDFMFGNADIKPYLRPMSSMTEEEFEDLKRRYVFCESCRDENDVMDVVNRGKIEFCDAANVLSWLNAHYFDYRGLIEKGLALEAPEGMYNFEKF